MNKSMHYHGTMNFVLALLRKNFVQQFCNYLICIIIVVYDNLPICYLKYPAHQSTILRYCTISIFHILTSMIITDMSLMIIPIQYSLLPKTHIKPLILDGFILSERMVELQSTGRALWWWGWIRVAIMIDTKEDPWGWTSTYGSKESLRIINSLRPSDAYMRR